MSSIAEALEKIESLPGQVQALFSSFEGLRQRVEKVEKRDGETANTREISAALAEFQSLGIVVPKSRTVEVKDKSGKATLYTFKYAPYDVIVNRIQPMLGEMGLSYSHDFKVDPGDKLSATLTTTLHHSSGQRLTFDVPVDLQRYDYDYDNKTHTATNRQIAVQELGSAITYAKRYGIAAILGLAVDDDDDGNVADGQTIAQQISDEQAAGLVEIANQIEEHESGFTNKYLTHLRIGEFADLPLVRHENVKAAMEKRLQQVQPKEEGGDDE